MTSEDIQDLADKKQRKELLESFVEQIATNKTLREQFKYKLRETSAEHRSPSLKSFWTLAHVVYNDYEDTLAITKTLFEIVFAMYDDYSERITKIEKEIQSIAENTGTNLSKVKTDVDQLKETVGPKINAVIQPFANLQKEEERKKRSGADMLV